MAPDDPELLTPRDDREQKNTMLLLVASATGLKESVDLLRRDISGTPNLIERISGGNWRVAAAALAVIVSLSALVGSVTGTMAFIALSEAFERHSLSARLAEAHR